MNIELTCSRTLLIDDLFVLFILQWRKILYKELATLAKFNGLAKYYDWEGFKFPPTPFW
jgi:hypothetical protein